LTPVPSLRETFDNVAEIYDRIRPRYPAALFEELFARLPESPAVVEVGPGTGQATAGLLERGAQVTAIELGPNLAERLRSNFAGHDRLKVLVSSFEDSALASHSFDALVSATAYHWVPAEFRVAKPAEFLRPGGWVAIIDTLQVSAPTDSGFFERAQSVYQRHGEPADRTPAPTPERATSPYVAEFEDSPRFDPPAVFRYRWDQTYDTGGYADLMRSYSVSQAMPERKREALISDMAELIDHEFGGHVTRPLVITLMLARTRR
jgi:SAM-dependent methyltransferase